MIGFLQFYYISTAHYTQFAKSGLVTPQTIKQKLIALIATFRNRLVTQDV